MALAYGWFAVSLLRFVEGPAGPPVGARGEQDAFSVIPLPDDHAPTYVVRIDTIFRGKFTDRSAKRVRIVVSDSGGHTVLDDTVPVVARDVGGDPQLSGSHLIVRLVDGGPSAVATLTYAFDHSQKRFIGTDVVH